MRCRWLVRHVMVLEAEVMAELVDHGFADLPHCLAARRGHAHDRAAEDRDLVGQLRQHVVSALRHGHAAVDAEELVVLVAIAECIQVVVVRLLFDYYRDVLEQVRKLRRERFERLFDEALELTRRDDQALTIRGRC